MKRSRILLPLLALLVVLGVEVSAQKKILREVSVPEMARVTNTIPTSTSMGITLLQEDFSTAADSTPPVGWSNNILEGIATDKWRFDNPGNRITSFSSTAPAAVFDSDFLSPDGGQENVALESLSFSAPSNAVITLTFQEFFRSNPTGTKAVVDAFDGIRWVTVDSTGLQTSDPSTRTVDLTPHVAGVADARIRFRFIGNYSWYWFVDDVVVSATPILPSTWLLFENFKTASGNTPPAGWVINRMVGDPFDEWRFDNPGGRNFVAPMAFPVAIFDSDTISRLGGAEDVALESPAFTVDLNATVQLQMDHFFRGDSGGRATIEVFNGTSWIPVWDSVKSTPNPERLTLNISSFLSGVSDAKLRFRWRGWWSWWWAVDNIILTQTPGGGTVAGPIVSDPFNDPTLNTSVWTFENPKGDGSYSMTGTHLAISVPAGSSHDVTASGNLPPRVMQEVNNPQVFELNTKFDSNFQYAYQLQGIQIWDDSLNFLRLEFYTNGTSIYRLAWKFVGGVPQDLGTQAILSLPAGALFMRITRQGDNWTQSWSADGVTFTPGVAFSHAMTVNRIGVYAGNVGFPEENAPAFTGLFDYFLAYDPLPVQLARFTATMNSNGSVRLDWTTISETNNLGFEIQKTANPAAGFSTIPNSFIPGRGTTVTPSEYSWTDMNTSPGTWHYRLKQIDLDGTVHYSDPVQVDVVTSVNDEIPTVFALQQNFPNPFNPSTDIRFSVEATGPARLVVYNLLGQQIAELFNGPAESGREYSLKFHAENLASGLYLYRLEANGRTALRKMVLMR